MFGINNRIWSKNHLLTPCTKFFAFYCVSKKQFSHKIAKIFYLFKKKSKNFPEFFCLSIVPNVLYKKKRAAFGGELVVVGEGGGRWGMVSKGRGYEFDVCARLENSATTPSSIFLKFFPKNPKSDDCTWVFYCLK